MHRFFLYLKKAQKEFRMMNSFLLYLKKAYRELQIMQSLFLFPFPEGNTKGNSEWWIPFSLFCIKTKQEIGFACTHKVALFPCSSSTQMGSGNEAILQEYPIALD